MPINITDEQLSEERQRHSERIQDAMKKWSDVDGDPNSSPEQKKKAKHEMETDIGDSLKDLEAVIRLYHRNK